MTEFEKFKLASADLLEKYQHLEEALKECLRSYLNCLDVDEKRPFDAPRLNKITLGASVNEFAKICDDNSLVSDLKKTVAERNILAHCSLSLTIGESSDQDYLKGRISEIKNDTKFVTDLHNRVLDVRFMYKRRERNLNRESGTTIA
jgi:hypothetical protein